MAACVVSNYAFRMSPVKLGSEEHAGGEGMFECIDLPQLQYNLLDVNLEYVVESCSVWGVTARWYSRDLPTS